MNNQLSVFNRSARLILAVLVLLTMLLTGTSPALAAGLTVTTLDDELNADGDCSLREAITAANTDIAVDASTAGAGADSISVPAGTITLGSELPAVSTTLTITGNGAANTILQANANPDTATYRVLLVTPSGNLTLEGLTVRHGRCDFSCSLDPIRGGAIYNDSGTLIVANSTFSGNSASAGGAISNVGGTLTVSNSTFSGNSANSGGVLGNNGIATVTNSTFSGNSASSAGVIVNDTGINNTFHLRNTIIANSLSGGDCTTPPDTNINNLIEDGSCSPALSGDPNLGPLQDNGGPTHTMALLSGSPAIDAGDDTSCPATDQRGITRPQGPHCDIGAFEVEVQSIYDFSGFFSPVDNLPTLNTVKAGQAIPVKFSLDGDQGLDIFAPGYPQVQKIACDSDAPGDVVEETVSSGNSGLQYDTATGTYTYIWKTQKSWAGTCRQLIIKLDDGTIHSANFKFK
jgi:CSLREA domain-containing protein